jgi:hypothetical protein
MTRLTLEQVETALSAAQKAGSIRNVEYRDLTAATSNLLWRARAAAADSDITRGYWDRLGNAPAEHAARRALDNTPGSALHIGGWLKKAHAAKTALTTAGHTEPALTFYIAAFTPFETVGALLKDLKPVIVKGRKPDPEGDAKRALRLAEAKTCQYCGDPWKETPSAKGVSLIAHHGYRRPLQGSGVQTCSCPGARHLPYETSCDQIPGWIKEHQQIAQRHDDEAKRFAARPETVAREVVFERRNDKAGFVVICNQYGHTLRREKVTPENARAVRDVDGDYERCRALAQLNNERDARQHHTESNRLQRRLDKWTPDNKGWRA